MEKLCTLGANVRDWNFRVHKTIGVSYSRVIFRVHYIESHGMVSFDYFNPWKDHSNSLPSDPNINHMKTLCPREFEAPTYHFRVHKTIRIS